MIVPLLFAPLCLLMSVPVFIILRREPEGGLIGLAEKRLPGAVPAIAALYALLFLWAAAVNTARTALFVETVLFPDSRTGFIMLLLLIPAAYAASAGLETIGRTAFAVFVLSAAALLGTGAAAAGNFDLLNLSPPFMNGFLPVFLSAFHSVSRTYEIAALPFITGDVRRSVSKTALLWLGIISLTGTLLFTLSFGVAGAYGSNRLFLFFSVIRTASFGLLERPDPLISGLWLVCSFVKSAFFLFLACRLFCRLPAKKRYPSAPYLAALASAALAAAISPTADVLEKLLQSRFYEAVFPVFVTILPLLLLSADALRKRKNRRRTT